MKYNARLSEPSTSDKNWIKTTHGGYNYCIEISNGSCIPNCVGYAWGRWRELLGKYHNLSRGNAENWYGNTGDGYKRGKTPKPGAVICWSKGKVGNGNDGAGHVAIVEKINSDGSIVTSESGYKTYRFKTKTYKKSNNYYLGSSYTFQGFIYPPVEYEEDKPAPTTTLKYAKGDKVILNGYLYKDSVGNGRGAKKTNYKGTITIAKNGANKPYHIDSLGWVAESDLTKQTTTKYLNLQPNVSSWTVYKTNNYYNPKKESDILIKLNPKKYNGLSYKIYEDKGNYHFKIKTANKGYGYIAGNPNKYSCTITSKPTYKNGNY